MTGQPRRARPPTEVLYARLPADLVQYVRDQSDATGLSMAQVTQALLAICRDNGLRLTRPAPIGLQKTRLELPLRGASSPLAHKPAG